MTKHVAVMDKLRFYITSSSDHILDISKINRTRNPANRRGNDRYSRQIYLFHAVQDLTKVNATCCHVRKSKFQFIENLKLTFLIEARMAPGNATESALFWLHLAFRFQAFVSTVILIPMLTPLGFLIPGFERINDSPESAYGAKEFIMMISISR